jgi:hypothetical protein
MGTEGDPVRSFPRQGQREANCSYVRVHDHEEV